jgi:hypothetical protein
MSTVEANTHKLTQAERRVLVHTALSRFQAGCFWFMREDAQITLEKISCLCERLRADGARAGFMRVARLCG